MPDRDSSEPGQPRSGGARLQPGRLRLRITAAAETAVRSGHPWVYEGSIRDQNREGNLGELAVIFDRQDRFLAIGLFDPESPLRVRILHWGKPAQIDRDWWRVRLQESVAKRAGLFDGQTTGYRWAHGENDGWPGLVIDRYDQTLVAKLYTAAWLPRWEELTDLIRAELKPARLVLRLSRNIQELAQASFGRADGELIFGAANPQPAVFAESGLIFQADVFHGQKTGFFLDQRENRRRVGELARGRRVLNVFSFSGGFSLYAARGGALSVADLDISAHALKAGDENFKLNDGDAVVRACPRRRIQADGFEWLSQPGTERFDLIVLDPPSLARRESERAGAVQAYRRLVNDAVRHLAVGGVLVAASCSAHVSAEEFFREVRQTLGRTGRRSTELAQTLEPPDHPVTFPEAAYLKCIYFELGASSGERKRA